MSIKEKVVIIITIILATVILFTAKPFNKSEPVYYDSVELAIKNKKHDQDGTVKYHCTANKKR